MEFNGVPADGQALELMEQGEGLLADAAELVQPLDVRGAPAADDRQDPASAELFAVRVGVVSLASEWGFRAPARSADAAGDGWDAGDQGEVWVTSLTLAAGVMTGGDEICAWEAKTGRSLWKYVGGDYFCHGLSVINVADGRSILIIGHEDGAERWDARTGERLGSFPLDDTAVWSVDSGTLPNGQEIVVAGGYDRLVYRWSPATGEPLGPSLVRHQISVKTVALIPLPGGELMIASGDDDGVIHRWNADTGDPIGQPVDSGGGVIGQLASVPDGWQNDARIDELPR